MDAPELKEDAVSIRMPSPPRPATPPGFTSALARLASAGWRVEIPVLGGQPRPSYALIARGRNDQQKDVTMVIHGYDGKQEVRLEDLWRVVAHMNDIQADCALISLPSSGDVSDLAVSTARRLGVEIVRLD
jgi:hypothetical protein